MSTTISLVCCLFFMVALLQVIAAVEHQVGGDFGWNLPPTPTFFSEWARNKTFFVGDVLVFKSRANEAHTVGHPQFEADFDRCIEPQVVDNSSAFFIGFGRPGRRYFICTVGNHCNVGKKFSIDVLPLSEAPSAAVEPPPPLSSAAPPSVVAASALPVLIISITIMVNLFFSH